MTTPHKHRDVIIAWANGETIQWRKDESEEWSDLRSPERATKSNPGFYEEYQYRIKPKLKTMYLHLFSDGSVEVDEYPDTCYDDTTTYKVLFSEDRKTVAILNQL
jgi:hypothetical protein